MTLNDSGSSGDLFVAGAGLVAAVGFGVDAVSAAVRARLAWFREDDGAAGPGTRPVLATVPGIAGTGAERLAELCAPALLESLAPLRAPARAPGAREGHARSSGETRVHLLLAAAPADPVAGSPDPVDLAARAASLAPELAWAPHALETRGHAAGLLAIARARALAAEDPEALFLVGGACSHRDPACLARLEREGRLLSDTSPDGFVPGEAAAFCLLGTARALRLAGLDPMASLGPVGAADEPRSPGRAPSGRALAAAVRAALPPGPAPVGAVWCDLNGDSRRSDEWAAAYLLVAPRLGPRPALWHPADRWGDIGAATGPALIALAARELASISGRSALVLTSSDAGERAAVAVSAVAPGARPEKEYS